MIQLFLQWMNVCLKMEEYPSLTSLPSTPAVPLILIVVTVRNIAEVTIRMFCVILFSKNLVQVWSKTFSGKSRPGPLLPLLQCAGGRPFLPPRHPPPLAPQTLMLPPRHHYILQYALLLHHTSWNLNPTDTLKPGRQPLPSDLPLQWGSGRTFLGGRPRRTWSSTTSCSSC